MSKLWRYDAERCFGDRFAAIYDALRNGSSTATAVAAVAPRTADVLPDSLCVSGGQNARGVLGIDEAGRGSLAGPVVAAAAYLLPEAYLRDTICDGCVDIDDSKKLTRAEREAIFARLEQWRSDGLLRIEAGVASVEEIGRHNIVGATAIAMRRAVDALGLGFDLPAGACVKVGGKPSRRATQISETQTMTTFATASDVAEPLSAAWAELEITLEPGEVNVAEPLSAARAELQCLNAPPGQTAGRAGQTANGSGQTANRAEQTANGSAQTASRTGQTAHHAGLGPSECRVAPYVWVDGLPMPKRLPWAHEGIVSGDATSLAIAMASVWAKVTRDRLLEALAADFPQYGWAENCGYGTPLHRAALRAHGPCVHHRPRFLQKLGLGDAPPPPELKGLDPN